MRPCPLKTTALCPLRCKENSPTAPSLHILRLFLVTPGREGKDDCFFSPRQRPKDRLFVVILGKEQKDKLKDELFVSTLGREGIIPLKSTLEPKEFLGVSEERG